MEDIVSAIDRLNQTLGTTNILIDLLIPLASIILSVSAIIISLHLHNKNTKISLLPEKEKVYQELEQLMFYYITYMASENPFEENKFSYGSVVVMENDILRRAKMFFGAEDMELIDKIKDKHLEIGILNLEAQVYFEKLKEKSLDVYEKLKKYIIESTPLSEFDFKREEEIASLCYENKLYLNQGSPDSNYYELRKKIKVLKKELSTFYLQWQNRKEKLISL